MKTKKCGRVMAALLSLIMCLSMVPMTAFAYMEGDIPGTTGTGASIDNPVVCDTFAEFKAAMENTEIDYVKLTGTDEMLNMHDSLTAAIRQTTHKTLIVNGTNTFTSPLDGFNDSLIWSEADLKIQGMGTLKYRHGNSGGHGAVVYKTDGSLIINKGIRLVGHVHGTSFGRALCLDGGNTTIRGGSFFGYKATKLTASDIDAVVVDNGATLTVEDGDFSSSLDSGVTNPVAKAYGLSVMKGSTVILKGGKYEGIRSDSNLSTLLDTDCSYRKSNGSIFDGAAVNRTSETLTVFRIPKIDAIPYMTAAVGEDIYIPWPDGAERYELYQSGIATPIYQNTKTGSPEGMKIPAENDASTTTYYFRVYFPGADQWLNSNYFSVTRKYTEISAVNLTNSAPEVGKTPKDMTYSADSGIEKGGYWLFPQANAQGGSMAATDTFEDGKTYSAAYRFTIPATAGKVFASTVTVTASNGTVYQVNRVDDTTLEVTVNFDPIGSGSVTEISAVNLTNSAPEVGKTPNDMTYSADSGIVKGGYWFFPQADAQGGSMAATDTFEDGKTYSAAYRFTIPATAGKVFASTVTVTASNGTVYKVNRVDDTTLEVTVNFDPIGSGVTTYSVSIVTLIANGTVVASPTGGLSAGDLVTLTVTPDPGYVLESIIVKDDGANLVPMETENTFKMPASNVRVDATFKEAPVTPVKYNVRINPMTNGSVTADKTQAAGGELVKLTATPDAGYVLDTIQVLHGMGAEVALNADHSFTMPSEDVVVNATFKEAPVSSHTVTFNTNGGSAVPEQTVADGATATKPADPTKDGYTFEGWYQDATFATAFDFTTPITADITLYAKWKDNGGGTVTLATYAAVTGGNGIWTKNSGLNYELTVKRSVDDNTCFSHFVNVLMDGAVLTPGVDYDAKAGSTIVTLKASALQKLSAGSHTVTVNFDDGKVDTTLTVKKAPVAADKDTTPNTGDNNRIGMWLALMLLSLAGTCGTIVLGGKRRNEK